MEQIHQFSEETVKWLTRICIFLVFIGQALFWEHYVTWGYFDWEITGHETLGVLLTTISMIALIWLKRKR